MTQNEIYEMVADFGEVYGTALRRDSYLTRGIDWPENWLALGGTIGDERAEQLSEGQHTPTQDELRCLIRWQIEHALAEENPSITPTIWLCQKDRDDAVVAIEGWGDSISTELKFVFIGRYCDEFEAVNAIRKSYIFDADEL